MTPSAKTVVVAGRSFTLEAQILGDELIAACRSADARDIPLTAVLGTAMGRPSDLIEQIRTKGSQGWEGDVAYSYHSDDEDEPPPGSVACYYFEDTLIVPESEFEALARELARYAIEASAAAGVRAKDEEALLDFLRDSVRTES